MKDTTQKKKPEKMMKPSSKIKGMMLFPSLEANTGKKAAAVDKKKHEQEESREEGCPLSFLPPTSALALKEALD